MLTAVARGDIQALEVLFLKYQSKIYQTALEELHPKHRAVLVLYYLHDYPLTEIASIVGVPEGTVKSRLFYVRKLLKQRLEQQYGSNDLLLPDPS